MQTTAILEDLTEVFSETVSGGWAKTQKPGGDVTQDSDEKVYDPWFKGQGGKCFIMNDRPKGTIIYPDDPSQYPILVGNK